MGEATGELTKEALLDAAERLMAEHGIEGADLAEIHRNAGQRNRSAIAYHFGDRDGLVMAIATRRRAPANRTRNHLLDELEQAREPTIPALASALVRPLAVNLRTAGGRSHLIVLAEATTHLGSSNLLTADRTHVDSMHRLGTLLADQLTGPAPRRRRTINQAILITPILLADIAREINNQRITVRSARLRVDEVVQFVANTLV